MPPLTWKINFAIRCIYCFMSEGVCDGVYAPASVWLQKWGPYVRTNLTPTGLLLNTMFPVQWRQTAYVCMYPKYMCIRAYKCMYACESVCVPLRIIGYLRVCMCVSLQGCGKSIHVMTGKWKRCCGLQLNTEGGSEHTHPPTHTHIQSHAHIYCPAACLWCGFVE